jgi:hypothetical protein
MGAEGTGAAAGSSDPAVPVFGALNFLKSGLKDESETLKSCMQIRALCANLQNIAKNPIETNR